MKVNSSLELIGNTPHLRLKRLFPSHEVWLKLEKANPGGSIKDRIALAMITEAEKSEKIKPGGTIVEPTSGNTGIGLAMVGAVLGYRVVLVMPDSMSVERRTILQAYGCELVLTPRSEGMTGAIEEAKNIHARTPNSFIPMQFENENNPKVHYVTTAREILGDFPQGVNFFFSGIGSGGHISGVGKALKEYQPDTHVVGVEPLLSPVLSGGNAGPHPLQGIGAGFIPKVLQRNVMDEVVTIEGDDAFAMVRSLARKEGVLAGISTGAVLAAIAKGLSRIPEDSTVLAFCYDTGERYLSVEGLW